MKKISINQLDKGLYLVQTDGSEGHNFPPIVSALRRQLEAAGFAVSLVVEPIGDTKHLKVQQVHDKASPLDVAEKLLRMAMKQLADGKYPYPFRWDTREGLVFVRTEQLAGIQTDGTCAEWGRRVSGRVLRKQLALLGLLVTSDDGVPMVFEKTIGGIRARNLIALKLAEVSAFLAEKAPCVKS